jgi:phage baseplate assembly protein W
MTRIISTVEQQNVRYSDFLNNFDVNPITGNLAKVTNSNSIKQALRNRILTNRGERFYDTGYGSNIKAQLFDLASPETADNLRIYIESCVKQEPRVSLINLAIFDEEGENAYRIDLSFSIINIPDTQNLQLILKRVR